MHERNKIINLVSDDDTTEQVTATEFKTFAKIEYSTDDSLIELLITTARQSIEQEANISLVDKEVTLIADIHREQELPFPEVDSVTSLQRWSGSDWDTALTVDEDYFLFGSVLQINSCGRFKIIYDTLKNEAQGLKDAIKMRTLALYEHRGDDDKAYVHPKWIESTYIVERFKNYSWA